MDSAFDAFLRSWPSESWVFFSLSLTALLYLRGWLVLHRRDGERWTIGQPVAFGGGLLAVFVALASPIEPFASLLLQVHMLQHLLLMMVAPPLLWLGAPFFPLLRGLPRPIRQYWVAPLLRWPFLRNLFTRLTHPGVALVLFTAATWIWHLPPIYDLALRSNRWHYWQHACFLGTALLFWYPVIRPYPSRPSWSLWLLIPYLILADVQNTILSAVLTFADGPLYAYYVERPRLGNLSVLEDQAAAGVLMWVPGSVAFLVPVFVIGIRLLFGANEATQRVMKSQIPNPKSQIPNPKFQIPNSKFQIPNPQSAIRNPQSAIPNPQSQNRVALPVLGKLAEPAALDVLRVPVLGRFLHWRHARLAMQIPLLILAGVIVYDGFRGPGVGAMNLAGVLPWIHWRGLVVFGLLVAGNVFCMACPFMAPRTLARRWLPGGWAWPRWLRNKWLAVVLLVAFLWAYEAFALWDSPWWTAWLVLAYFVAAFVVDGFFRGASFCKYVCPIGQFNFVQSLVSPLEIRVREPARCTSCSTKDCIRGTDLVPGCELHLFQPRKSSNMDCTFCLDCIHACPHDNIGITTAVPGAELWRDPHRSGVGRFGRRLDLAVLIVVLVFGAFASALWMTGPYLDWQDGMISVIGSKSSWLMSTAVQLATLVVLPLLLMGCMAWASRWWGGLSQTWREVAARYTFALIPLGFGMWVAHYSFHFFTSYATVVPTAQRFVADLGGTFLGSPEWSCACCVPQPGWLLRLEILSLDLGLLLSLYTGYRIAQSQTLTFARTLFALAPWALLLLCLFALGIWIVFQPMQMRGTMPM